MSTPRASAVQVGTPNGSFPGNCDVHGRDLECPVNVDTCRPLRANSGHLSDRAENVCSTSRLATIAKGKKNPTVLA